MLVRTTTWVKFDRPMFGLSPEAGELPFRKEETHLPCRILVAVRPMHRVPTLGLGVQLPDGPGCRLGGVRGSNDFPEMGHGIRSFQGHREAGPAGHEGDKIVVEWPAFMNFEEGSRRGGGHAGRP